MARNMKTHHMNVYTGNPDLIVAVEMMFSSISSCRKSFRHLFTSNLRCLDNDWI